MDRAADRGNNPVAVADQVRNVADEREPRSLSVSEVGTDDLKDVIDHPGDLVAADVNRVGDAWPLRGRVRSRCCVVCCHEASCLSSSTASSPCMISLATA